MTSEFTNAIRGEPRPDGAEGDEPGRDPNSAADEPRPANGDGALPERAAESVRSHGPQADPLMANFGLVFTHSSGVEPSDVEVGGGEAGRSSRVGWDWLVKLLAGLVALSCLLAGGGAAGWFFWPWLIRVGLLI